MSNELKFCKSFIKVCHLAWHGKNKKIRKKNSKRARKMLFQTAIKKFGSMPVPLEWR